MKYDLHTHSNCSDGELEPSALIQRAVNMDVGMLSITDHDSVAAYEKLKAVDNYRLTLIPGLEISCNWLQREIHVLGLNIDVSHPEIKRLESTQKSNRLERARKILKKISRKTKIEIQLDDLPEHILNQSLGRPHIASLMVKKGIVKNENAAFENFLGNNQSYFVKTDWVSLSEAVNVIRESGGVAVIAHPLKYNLTRTRLLELVNTFKTAGGEAIEVVSGHQHKEQITSMAVLASKAELYASCGSDFHRPGQKWSELGTASVLPEAVQPVWELFN